MQSSMLAALALFSLAPARAEPLLPLLPIQVAPTWPANNGTFHYGEIRAELEVGQSSGNVEAQIFWRRRDPAPDTKALVVTDAKGKWMKLAGGESVVEAGCGIVSFEASSGQGKYYVYFLSFFEHGCTSPQFHFSWFNGTWPKSQVCDGEEASNVLAPPGPAFAARRASSAPSVCTTVQRGSKLVKRLQSRDEFHGFSPIELIAQPSEMPQPASFPLFVHMTTRDLPLRTFDNGHLPALWARAGESTSLSAKANAGQYFVFQIGLFAHKDITNVTLSFADLKPSSGSPVPSSAFTCFNLGGVLFL